MENQDKKQDLILDLSNSVQDLIRKTEQKIGDTIKSCDLYYGDIVVDDVETEGTKIIFSDVKDFKSDNLDDDDEIELEDPFTLQDMLRAWFVTKNKLIDLCVDATGLFLDEYINMIELEKRECRKAIACHFDFDDKDDLKSYNKYCELL